MQQLKDVDELDDIVGWLQRHAAETGLSAVIHPEWARRDDEWLHIPVRIEGEMGAFDRAERLQALEDAWDEQHPDDKTKLLLVPTAR